MSGIRKNLKEVIWNVGIEPFYLAKYPVTEKLYSFIMENKQLVSPTEPQNPVVKVSWIDAVNFCKLLSDALGFEKFYHLDPNSKEVVCNYGTNGFRLPTDAEWQYACKAQSKGYRYGVIDKIAWHKDNSGNRIRHVGQQKPND
jgi:formylglycine-generating enzyme required for sulfatase activity